MRDPKFEKYEDFIDVLISKGNVTEDDETALWKRSAYSFSKAECRAYLAARLAEKEKEDKEFAKEEALLNAQRVQSNVSGNYGTRKICPNCGEPIEAGTSKCNACGYAFTGIGANQSAKELDRRLRQINGTSNASNERRANIISSFPIPNTREDLIEFLSALEPKAFNRHKGEDAEQKIGKAYYEKYVECLNKARVSFPNDPAVKMFEANYAKDKKKLHLTSTKWMIIGGIIVPIVLLVLAGIMPSSEDIMLKASIKEREQREKKEAILEEEFADQRKQSMAEIEEYAQSLYNQLEALPTPNASNYQSCASKLARITWSKSWPVPTKYHEIVPGMERYEGLEYESKERFEEAVKQYKKLIGAAWKQSCKARGLDEREIRNEIPSEYR